MKLGQKKEKQVPNGQTYHRLPMFHQLIIIRGDFHQPRGGGTSDEQGELDTRIQDGHFTSLCGKHRSHQNPTFHVCINTTAIQTKKKHTHIKRIAHSLYKRITHSFTLKRIVHSFRKHIVHSFTLKRIVHSFRKRIVHSFKKNRGAPSLGLHSWVWHKNIPHE